MGTTWRWVTPALSLEVWEAVQQGESHSREKTVCAQKRVQQRQRGLTCTGVAVGPSHRHLSAPGQPPSSDWPPCVHTVSVLNTAPASHEDTPATSRDVIPHPKASETSSLPGTAEVLSRPRRRLSVLLPFHHNCQTTSPRSLALTPSLSPQGPGSSSNQQDVLLSQELCKGCPPAWNSLLRISNALLCPLLQPVLWATQLDSQEHFGPFLFPPQRDHHLTYHLLTYSVFCLLPLPWGPKHPGDRGFGQRWVPVPRADPGTPGSAHPGLAERKNTCTYGREEACAQANARGRQACESLPVVRVL